MYWQTPSPAPAVEDRYVGVRALWIKVIIRAAFDWVSYRDSSNIRLKKLAESASTWLFQPSELFNSFEGVCKFVDLPPEKVRGWVQALTKEHVAKIEHLERDCYLNLPLERPLLQAAQEDDDEEG